MTRVLAGELAALVDGRDGGLHCWERQRTADDDPRSRGDYLRCRKGFLADQAADTRIASRSRTSDYCNSKRDVSSFVTKTTPEVTVYGR